MSAMERGTERVRFRNIWTSSSATMKDRAAMNTGLMSSEMTETAAQKQIMMQPCAARRWTTTATRDFPAHAITCRLG